MREKLGSLSCLVRPGEDSEKHVVLLHGFGADASDLFPLADILDPETKWNFIVPDAPLEIPVGPSWTGRAWFPISLRELEVGVDFTQIRPPGLEVAVSVVDELLFHLDSKKLVLGGFSQGAMVATEIAMSQPESIAGLILYSGVLLDEPGWKKKAAGLKGKPILQSHGMQDPVLPAAAAQKLHELLKGAGAEISFNGFNGQHEIPNVVLNRTREFLSKLNP